jgi:histo-blood group ABO system transferase
MANENIGIIIIATGKYIQFFDKLYKSIEEKFLINHSKTFYLFTDSPIKYTNKNIEICPITRKGFPGDTLFRYHYLLMQKKHMMENVDVLYYMDVDSLVVDYVGSEILPTIQCPLVATLHPGFYKTSNPTGTPDKNLYSSAFIADNEIRNFYVCGGFNGGKTMNFLIMAEKLRDNIDTDTEKGIMAIWHDESHFNRYYVSNQAKFLILNPSYMFPESWGNRGNLRGLTKRILALDKNHAEIRN